MKTALLGLVVAQAAAYSLSSNGAPAPAPAAAPAAGPAGGPAAALNAFRLTFEIKNYNYLDLTKQTCPEAAPKKRIVKAKKAEVVKGKVQGHNAVEKFADSADNLGNDLVEVGEGIVGKADEKPPPPPWMDEKKGASLVQADKRACHIQHSSLAAIHSKSDACKTVMDVFRAAIAEVVRDVIKCTAPASGPAPVVAAAPAVLELLPPQAFLQKAASAPSAAPAGSPSAGGPPDPVITVTFSPGEEVKYGRTTVIEITFTDKPNNGLDDVALTAPIIKGALAEGTLMKELKAALQILSGIVAKVGKTTTKMTSVEAWNMKKCEKHIRSLVENFSRTYTKEQVPMAMYNECTNFVTRMSFSNDHVLDKVDTAMCRKTTAKFAKHWNVGEKAKDEDFELMCVRSCEAKFGKDAPRCNVEAGDALAGQPL